MTTTLKNPEEIRQLLAEACARKELVILATPYLRFGDAIAVAAAGLALALGAAGGRGNRSR